MSLESFKKRMSITGTTPVSTSKNATQENNRQAILHSPTRKTVRLNDNPEDIFCIMSDIDSYEIREFLMMPNVVVNKGDYIRYETDSYLAVKGAYNDDYPTVKTLFCNFDFPIETVIVEQIVGYLPNGRPDIRKVESIITKPSVMSGKIYTTFDNSPIQLAEGSLSILIPFDNRIPNVNQKINVYGSQYKVVDIVKDHILRKGSIFTGYLDIRLQREVNSNG